METLRRFLPDDIRCAVENDQLVFARGHLSLRFDLNGGVAAKESLSVAPALVSLFPEKIAFLIRSRLGANDVVFARNCDVRAVSRPVAEQFTDRFHLLGYAGAAWHRGLFYNDELIALASFSKGRKMRHLRDDQRSYEMTRFCVKGGVSVAGGLSKLVVSFCRERNAAEVMTYVDLQLGDGSAFKRAGFEPAGITPPVRYTMNGGRVTKADVDHGRTIESAGNLKMTYSYASS